MTMFKLPTIFIRFNSEIEFNSLPFFRGAVIASLRRDDILFHNHDEDRLRYSYPLIQYKRIHKKASVMGIGKGIESISQLLGVRNLNLQVGSRQVRMCIEAVDAHDNEIILTDEVSYGYRLHSWLPLNSSNYAQYQRAESMVARLQLLERVLTGNILSFLNGIGYHLEQQLVVHITDITDQYTFSYKGVVLMAFNIEFKTNIQLPQYIGIGKNASVGCGVVTYIKQ